MMEVGGGGGGGVDCLNVVLTQEPTFQRWAGCITQLQCHCDLKTKMSKILTFPIGGGGGEEGVHCSTQI